MKRYIDVDEFKLPCTSEDCHECIFFSLNRCIMKEHINNSTIVADIVEVVRCKDCGWYEDPDKKIFENCVRGGRIIPMQPTDYCSYGKRRNNE